MEEKEEEIVVMEYVCRHCGSTFYTASNKKIEVCAICESTSFDINNRKISGNLSIIPFRKTIAAAQRDYNRKTMWNPLIPFSFKGKKRVKSIQKVFLPALLVNASQKGQFVFSGEDHENSKRTVEVKKYDVYENVRVDYQGVLLNSSTKINERKFISLCDYDCKQVRDFNPSDIKEASYLLGDVYIEEAGEKGRKKISKNTLMLAQNEVRHSYSKLKEDNTVIEFSDSKQVLLPVYLLSVSYKDKIYQYMMNGENGKSHFSLPVAFFPTFLFFLLLFGILFSIGYFIIQYL